jgi:hypothetical protein
MGDEYSCGKLMVLPWPAASVLDRYPHMSPAGLRDWYIPPLSAAQPMQVDPPEYSMQVDPPEPKKEGGMTIGDCPVCLESAPRRVAYNCGHALVCVGCDGRVGAICPICRAEITLRIPLFQ